LESDNINGSPSYVRLKKQFKSLELGHRASKELGSAFSARSGSSVGDQLLQINMQMSSSLNGYLCASFLAGTIQVSATALEKEAEATANRTLITVFNRLALETIQIRAQMKIAAEETEKGKQGLSIPVADRISSILQDRKAVGTDLNDLVTLSAMLAVDASDPTAQKTDAVSMTCKEREDLMHQITILANATPVDEFTRAAKRYEEFLTNHRKCK
jgi:hypothetical protein